MHIRNRKQPRPALRSDAAGQSGQTRRRSLKLPSTPTVFLRILPLRHSASVQKPRRRPVLVQASEQVQSVTAGGWNYGQERGRFGTGEAHSRPCPGHASATEGGQGGVWVRS